MHLSSKLPVKLHLILVHTHTHTHTHTRMHARTRTLTQLEPADSRLTMTNMVKQLFLHMLSWVVLEDNWVALWAIP